MVYTHEGIYKNITISMDTFGTLKKSSARNSLSQFLALLDVNYFSVCRMGFSKTNCKAIWTGSDLWYIIKKMGGHKKKQ